MALRDGSNHIPPGASREGGYLSSSTHCSTPICNCAQEAGGVGLERMEMGRGNEELQLQAARDARLRGPLREQEAAEPRNAPVHQTAPCRRARSPWRWSGCASCCIAAHERRDSRVLHRHPLMPMQIPGRAQARLEEAEAALARDANTP